MSENNFNIEVNLIEDNSPKNINIKREINYNINYPSIDEIITTKNSYYDKISENYLNNICVLKQPDVSLELFTMVDTSHGKNYGIVLYNKSAHNFNQENKLINFQYTIKHYDLYPTNLPKVIFDTTSNLLFEKLVDLIKIEDVTII